LNYRGFVETSLLSYVVFACAAAVAIALGHLLAPAEPGMKVALTVETAMRNPGLAILIAVVNFPQAKPLAVLLPGVIVAALFVMLYTKIVNRRMA
jgi:predicted Na+-dependent transporter